jgi:hypothetical protein
MMFWETTLRKVIKIHNRGSVFLFPALLILSLFLFNPVSKAQDQTVKDTISKAFYDTLRVRTEKNKITRLIYDFLVVNEDMKVKVRDRMSSTKPFDQYEGMIIRNIQIVRLNAFGTDVDDPLYDNPTNTEHLLNASYIKTRHFVLQKYLLFKEGDVISPLVLSDNERFLRNITLVEDARIIVVPVSEKEADIMVVIRESYPLGFSASFKRLNYGNVTMFDKNFLGLGHELDINFPFDYKDYPMPGIGASYSIKNIFHSFSNLTLEMNDGIGTTKAGITLLKPFVSSETKYSWSANLSRVYTTEYLGVKLDTSLRYTFQDYWIARSFMLDKKSVTRFIVTMRHINNNVFHRPVITSNSYYPWQKYKLFIGSMAVSSQKFYNTSLIYSYGRTEDIPYGYLLQADGGIEFNEFKRRTYAGFEAAYGNLFNRFGYLYLATGVSTFYYKSSTEQGLFQAKLEYFSPLIRIGEYKMRSFINIYFIHGFNRNTDEFLYFNSSSLVRGFINDSIRGDKRLIISYEPVLFSPNTRYGFRFAFFSFFDTGVMYHNASTIGKNVVEVYSFGLGVRIRNDQLLFNTIQIRLGFYPVLPEYTRARWVDINSIGRLKPPDFDPGPPVVFPYK